MQTRRKFLGSVGATAALSVTGRAAFGGGTGSGGESSTKENGEERSSADTAAAAAAASSEKMLFWVAASTPCDKDLKFDPELYKDLLAYLKGQGADGVVVLGTTGEFPSFLLRSGRTLRRQRSRTGMA